jgi:hypothetical protein
MLAGWTGLRCGSGFSRGRLCSCSQDRVVVSDFYLHVRRNLGPAGFGARGPFFAVEVDCDVR